LNPDGFKLGAWVKKQRSRRRSLAEERARRLEALPGWAWHRHEAAWEDGFAALQDFVKNQGHSRVPDGHSDAHGFRLGDWVGTQRQFRRRGKLSEERAHRLEALSGWRWNLYDAAWEEGFARLWTFAEREGHARVPQSYRDDGYQLGNWVINQRQFRRRGKLSDERVRRLEALPGWAWEIGKAGARRKSE
jgi:hypothetical protein